MTLRIGTAGWTIPRQWSDEFPAAGSHLERYASRFPGVEINSSFHRQHRRATYERWAASVPEGFRFAAKLPRAITHDQRLVATDVLLDVFLGEVTGLGTSLGPLIVQLPPSLAFHPEIVDEFFSELRARYAGSVGCEPRHASWFASDAETLLVSHRIARVGADPSCVPGAARAGGWSGLAYYRLHGSPRMYYSAYGPEQLAAIGERLAADARRAEEVWCMFDNTTLGAATGDALWLRERR